MQLKKQIRKTTFYMMMLSLLMLILATLSYQETTERYRICHYEALGSEYVITVRLTDTCPLVIEVEV